MKFGAKHLIENFWQLINKNERGLKAENFYLLLSFSVSNDFMALEKFCLLLTRCLRENPNSDTVFLSGVKTDILQKGQYFIKVCYLLSVK